MSELWGTMLPKLNSVSIVTWLQWGSLGQSWLVQMVLWSSCVWRGQCHEVPVRLVILSSGRLSQWGQSGSQNDSTPSLLSNDFQCDVYIVCFIWILISNWGWERWPTLTCCRWLLMMLTSFLWNVLVVTRMCYKNSTRIFLLSTQKTCF